MEMIDRWRPILCVFGDFDKYGMSIRSSQKLTTSRIRSKIKALFFQVVGFNRFNSCAITERKLRKLFHE